MTIGQRRLRDLSLTHDRVERTDGDLLEAFIGHSDRAALEALVMRHAAMVWGVCRRHLDYHDAEDAFQATFLVLMRKASSILPRNAIGNWLYGVARQTALNLRTKVSRRSARETPLMAPIASPAPTGQPDAELLPVLDRELCRLPDKYRAAIVLCDLEGRTRKEAARELGLPEGTVASRLVRGKALLAQRLSRYAFAVSAATVEAALLNKASAAPDSLTAATIQIVRSMADGSTGAGTVPMHVITLSKRVAKTMFLHKLKTIMSVLAIGALVLSGSMAVGYSVWGADPPATQSEQPANEPVTVRDNPKPAKGKTDQELLQGVWKLVEIDSKGKKTTDEEVSLMRFKIEKDHMEIYVEGKTGGRVRKKTFTLGASKSPKEIDITSLDGAEEGEVAACIYKLEKDKLTLCMPYWTKEINKRPKEFKASVDDGLMVMFLERVHDPLPKARAARKVAALMLARLDAAKDAFTDAWNSLGEAKRVAGMTIPVGTPEEAYTWSVRWLNARLEVIGKGDGRVTAYEEHLQRMKDVQKRTDTLVGTLPKLAGSAARWYVAEAELWLAREQAK